LETLYKIDEGIFIWLNGWVGYFPWLDFTVELVISDYAIPVMASLVMFGLWFSSKVGDSSGINQMAVLNAIGALAIANMMVDWLINSFYFRPRPFINHEVNLLFYEPTDSSFPSNPAAVSFAVATGIFYWNKPIGIILYCLAVIFSISRVYGGVSYPFDAFGGAMLGVTSGAVVTVAIVKFQTIPQFVIKIARSLHLG
jgi:undecaprenyl-diphosphatase